MEYDGTSAIYLVEFGVEKFGITFSFTRGKETADCLAYVMQKDFCEFIEKNWSASMGGEGAG